MKRHHLNKRHSLAILIFVSLFLIIAITRIFTHRFYFQSLRLSSVVDRNVENEMARQRLSMKNRKAAIVRKYNDWRDEAISKVESASFSLAWRIARKLYNGKIYDPGEAAAVVVAELGIHNPDMALITKISRQKLNPASIKKGLETAHQNQAALYFSLPLIKDSIIRSIEATRAEILPRQDGKAGVLEATRAEILPRQDGKAGVLEATTGIPGYSRSQ